MSDSKWYFTNEQILNSPSRRDGIDTEREAYCRQCAAKLIQEVGQRLQLNQLAINTAVVYVHRFYMFHSFSRFQRHLIAPAALFLAAKVEEQPRKLEFVIRMANFTQERVNIEPKSQAYVEKVQQMIYHENVILQTLGFELAIEHPHTYVVNFFQSMRTKSLHSNEYDSQASESDLAKKAYYVATNSLHLTTLCLQYRPSLVACVCIYLVCKWNSYEQITFSDYQVIDPGCTMKMVENVASIVEKHQQFMKKLGHTVGTGVNTSNLEYENLSRASKPSLDTTSTTNHNNNVAKSCIAKEISPTLSSSAKTVLTPKEYLDKRIKEKINRESVNHGHQDAKHATPTTSDKQNLVKNIGEHASPLLHHRVGKVQMSNETLSKNSNLIQNTSKNNSDLPHIFENIESVRKSHKIHSESRHKFHKISSSASNKTSKIHSKDHMDSVNSNSANAHKFPRSQFDSNIKTSSPVFHREFKAPPEYKIPKSIPEPAHKISKSHSEPDSLAYKSSSLSSEPSYKINKVQTKESPQKIRSVVPDTANFKSNGEHYQKVTKVLSNFDNEFSGVTECIGKVAAVNIDNRMLRFSSKDACKTTNEQLEIDFKTSDIIFTPMQDAYKVPPESDKETSKLRVSSIDSLNCGIKMPQLTYKIPKVKVDSSFKEYKNSSDSTNTTLGRINLESGYKRSSDYINTTSSRMNVDSNLKNSADYLNTASGRMNMESGHKNLSDSTSTISGRMNLESSHKSSADYFNTASGRMNVDSGYKNSSDSTNTNSGRMNLESSHKNSSDSTNNISARMNLEPSHKSSADYLNTASGRMNAESVHKNSSDSTNTILDRMNLEPSYKSSADYLNTASGRINVESNHKNLAAYINTASDRMNLEFVHKNSFDSTNTTSGRIHLESDHKNASNSTNTTSGRLNSESANRKFKSSSEYESKMGKTHSSTNVTLKTNYESVQKEQSETNKDLEISKIDLTNVAQSASINKIESGQRTHKISSNSSYKMQYDNIRTEAEPGVVIGNKFNSKEKSNDFKLIDNPTVPTHISIKSNLEPADLMPSDSSYLKPVISHSDPRLSKMDQNTAIKGLIAKIHSENSHKSHKSHSRSSHKSHKKHLEKEHKRDLSEASLDSSIQPKSSRSHSKGVSQSSKPHHSNIKQEVSSECDRLNMDEPSKSYPSEIIHPTVLGSKIISSEHHAESKNIYKKYSHRANDHLYKRLPTGIEISTPTDSEIKNTNMYNLNPAQTAENVTLKDRLGLNDKLLLASEQNKLEHKAVRNTSSDLRMEGVNVMNSAIKNKNVCNLIEKIEVKNEALPLKEENKESVSLNTFNFNSNFSLHDVLKPSEKPPEDIFDTETDFKIAPCVSNIDTNTSKCVNPVPGFLKPELPPRIMESQSLTLKSLNSISSKSTAIYSLLPVMQQQLHGHKSSGSDSSILSKHSSAIAEPPKDDTRITTEEVHAFYKELEARQRAESRLEGVSDIRSAGQTFQAETSGTSKKREHKHKKNKKDRHGDKEHKKNKKSKKNKKDKHRDRSKGEEPLPSIKISVFNNLYMPKPESLPSQSDTKPTIANIANVSTEQSRIKLTIPFSRIHSNINTASLEIQSQAPKIKLKIPKESKKKSSKRSRGNSPESESRSSKRTRRSSSLTSVHNADYSKLSDSQQAPPYGSSDSHTSQDQNKIQIRHFSRIS